jgi:hypothetical protein
MYPIATTTLSTAGQVTFSSIPQTFTHLQLRCFIRGTNVSNATDNMLLTLNGDNTSGNYGYAHFLNGNGSAVSSSIISNVAGQSYGAIVSSGTTTANVFGAIIIDILDYTNTNKNKTIKSIGGFDGNGSGTIGIYSDAWYSTAAVNSLLLQITGSPFNFAAGSVLSLYGISTSNATGA